MRSGAEEQLEEEDKGPNEEPDDEEDDAEEAVKDSSEKTEDRGECEAEEGDEEHGAIKAQSEERDLKLQWRWAEDFVDGLEGFMIRNKSAKGYIEVPSVLLEGVVEDAFGESKALAEERVRRECIPGGADTGSSRCHTVRVAHRRQAVQRLKHDRQTQAKCKIRARKTSRYRRWQMMVEVTSQELTRDLGLTSPLLIPRRGGQTQTTRSRRWLERVQSESKWSRLTSGCGGQTVDQAFGERGTLRLSNDGRHS